MSPTRRIAWDAPLAEYVKSRRKELGLTFRTLEERTGITNRHINGIENGETVSPTCLTIVCLAEGLEISAVELFRIAVGIPEDKP